MHEKSVLVQLDLYAGSYAVKTLQSEVSPASGTFTIVSHERNSAQTDSKRGSTIRIPFISAALLPFVDDTLTFLIDLQRSKLLFTLIMRLR